MDFKVKKWQASASRDAIARQLMFLGVSFGFDGRVLTFDAPEVLIKALSWLDKIICSSNITEVIDEKAVRNNR